MTHTEEGVCELEQELCVVRVFRLPVCASDA